MAPTRKRVLIPTGMERDNQEYVRKLNEDLAYHKGMHEWYHKHFEELFLVLAGGEVATLELNRQSIRIVMEKPAGEVGE
jgi:hypothetical protein